MAKTQEVKFLITADGKRAVTGFNRVSGSMKRMSSQVLSTASTFLGFYAAIRGFSTVIRTTKDFETALIDMGKVTKRSFADLKADIMGLPAEIGGATELMKGYYQVISAGVTEPIKALETLTSSSMAAKAAHVSQAEVIKGLTKVMAGYEGEIKTTAEAADLLFAIEKEGQTSVAELIPVIGGLAKMSRDLSVSSNKMGAAIATITLTAGSTAEAATQYRAVLVALSKSTEVARIITEEFGYSGIQAAIKQEGLANILERLRDTVGGSAEAMSELLGRQEAMLGVSAMGAKNFETMNQKIVAMENKTGALASAFDDWKKTLEGVWDVLKVKLEKAIINLGDNVFPILKSILEGLSSSIDPLINDFVALWDVLISFPQGVIDFFRNLRDEMEKTSEEINEFTDPTPFEELWALLGRTGNDMLAIFTHVGMTVGNVFAVMVMDIITIFDGLISVSKPIGEVLIGIFTLDSARIKKGWADWKNTAADTVEELGNMVDAGFKVIGDSYDDMIAKMQKTHGVPDLIEAVTRKVKELGKATEGLGDGITDNFPVKAIEDAADVIVKELMGAYDTVEDKAEEMGKTTEDVFTSMRFGADITANNLVYSFESMFFDGFKSGLDALLDYFKRILARLASTALASRITIPINTALAGMGGLFPTYKAGEGFSSWLGGLGGLAAGAGGYMIGDQFGGYGKWGGLAGGLGGYALTSGLGSWLGGGAAIGLGMGGGSALGSAMGSIIPVIGTIAGALLGAWIGSLFGGKEKIPSTELVYRPEEGFWVKGVDKVGSEFTSSVIKAMDATRENLLIFMEAIGGDTSKFFEKFLSGSKNLDKEVDLEALFKKWAAQYSEFVTGIDFEEFQQKGEELSDTIDRIVGAVLAIAKFKGRDIIGIYREIQLVPKTLKETLDLITQGIYDAVDELSGLGGIEFGNKLSEIAGLIAARYEAEIQYLTYIKTLTESIAQSIQQQIEGFELSLMTPEEKIKQYQETLDDLFTDLQDATDPAQIEKIVDQIQQIAGAWWNVMTPEQQQASINEITDFLTRVNEVAQQQLSDAVNEQMNIVAELAQSLADIDWSPLGYLTTAAEQAAEALAGLGGMSVPAYQQGTPYVPQTGLAYVHQGEKIIPAGQSGGSGQPITIILEGDVSSINYKGKSRGF